MAAYRRLYDSRHLQADCQEPGSAPRNPTLGVHSVQRCYGRTSPLANTSSLSTRAISVHSTAHQKTRRRVPVVASDCDLTTTVSIIACRRALR